MIGLRRQVAAQAHGDGAGRNFREARGDHEPRGLRRRRHGAGNARRQRERHRQAVGHADDHVADAGGIGEMRFT